MIMASANWEGIVEYYCANLEIDEHGWSNKVSPFWGLFMIPAAHVGVYNGSRDIDF